VPIDVEGDDRELGIYEPGDLHLQTVMLMRSYMPEDLDCSGELSAMQLSNSSI